MASGPALALLLAILAVGLVLLGWAGVALAQWLRVWRRGRDATALAGPVALRGRPRPTEPSHALRAPLSGTETLWYEVSLQRDVGRPVRPQWETVGTEADSVPFDLERGDTTVRVRPIEATVDLEPRETHDFDASTDALAELQATVVSIGVDSAGGTLRIGPWTLDEGEHYRLVERRLDPGDSVSVTGRVEPTTSTDGDAPVVRVGGPDRHSLVRRLVGVPFVIADASGDDGPTRLRNRMLVGLVFGLPLALLAIVFMFPPGT